MKDNNKVLRPEVGILDWVAPSGTYAFIKDAQGKPVHINLGDEREVLCRSDGEAFFGRLARLNGMPPTPGSSVLFYRDDHRVRPGQAPHAHLWGLEPMWHREGRGLASPAQIDLLRRRFEQTETTRDHGKRATA